VGGGSKKKGDSPCIIKCYMLFNTLYQGTMGRLRNSQRYVSDDEAAHTGKRRHILHNGIHVLMGFRMERTISASETEGAPPYVRKKVIV